MKYIALCGVGLDEDMPEAHGPFESEDAAKHWLYRTGQHGVVDWQEGNANGFAECFGGVTPQHHVVIELWDFVPFVKE